VLYAVFAQGLEQVRICSAGHYPPVVATPGETAGLASIPSGLLIGAALGVPRRTATLTIEPGTLVCLYTDGLIERRGHSIDQGLARLREAVAAEPPDAACATVMAAMVGNEPAHDDIALLMIRRSPEGSH
jgi:phosphoserine phosphatase RsbU/P